jgi:predicted phosphoribosyltransferase
MIYSNRSEAGKYLATKLPDYANRHDVIVLALPRGGVPVGFEVAKALNAPLDIFLVRKLGVPNYEEYAMGAIATGDIRVLNEDTVNYLDIPHEVIDLVAAREMKELKRRERAYRGNRSEPEVRVKTVVLVDDGLATGSTMRAAVEALRQKGPSRIVVAVPVSAPDTCDEYRMGADEVVCASIPESFYGVGEWYLDFTQTSDEEVRELLETASASEAARNNHELAPV